MEKFAVEVIAKNGAKRTTVLGALGTLANTALSPDADGTTMNIQEIFDYFSEGEVMATYEIDSLFTPVALATPSPQAHRELCVRVGVTQTHPVETGNDYTKKSFFTIPCGNTAHMVAGTNNVDTTLGAKLKAWVDTYLQYAPYDTSKTYRYSKFVTYNS